MDEAVVPHGAIAVACQRAPLGDGGVLFSPSERGKSRLAAPESTTTGPAALGAVCPRWDWRTGIAHRKFTLIATPRSGPTGGSLAKGVNGFLTLVIHKG
jgi:hypothetical protein